MFWLFHDNKPWFAPSRYGFGTGLPITWKGWLLLALHVAAICGVAAGLERRADVQLPLILLTALLPLPLYAAKTRGGWRWRWGDDQ